jgi:hypothetical protein
MAHHSRRLPILSRIVSSSLAATYRPASNRRLADGGHQQGQADRHRPAGIAAQKVGVDILKTKT